VHGLGYGHILNLVFQVGLDQNFQSGNVKMPEHSIEVLKYSDTIAVQYQLIQSEWLFSICKFLNHSLDFLIVNWIVLVEFDLSGI